jgi:hypothetical protein
MSQLGHVHRGAPTPALGDGGRHPVTGAAGRLAPTSSRARPPRGVERRYLAPQACRYRAAPSVTPSTPCPSIGARIYRAGAATGRSWLSLAGHHGDLAERSSIRAVRFGPSRQRRRIMERAFGAPADLSHSAGAVHMGVLSRRGASCPACRRWPRRRDGSRQQRDRRSPTRSEATSEVVRLRS